MQGKSPREMSNAEACVSGSQFLLLLLRISSCYVSGFYNVCDICELFSMKICVILFFLHHYLTVYKLHTPPIPGLCLSPLLVEAMAGGPPGRPGPPPQQNLLIHCYEGGQGSLLISKELSLYLFCLLCHH